MHPFKSIPSFGVLPGCRIEDSAAERSRALAAIAKADRLKQRADIGAQAVGQGGSALLGLRFSSRQPELSIEYHSNAAAQGRQGKVLLTIQPVESVLGLTWKNLSHQLPVALRSYSKVSKDVHGK